MKLLDLQEAQSSAPRRSLVDGVLKALNISYDRLARLFASKEANAIEELEHVN